MVLLSVLDIILIVVGGAGMVYQAVCILISLFTKPVRFPEAPMDKRYAVLISSPASRRRPIRRSSSIFGWWPTTAPMPPPKWRAAWAAM